MEETPDAAARRLNAWLANAEPVQILQAALTREHAGRVALVSSFGTESAVLLHMAAQIDRDAPVLFIDTGKLFTKTLQYKEALVERLGLTNIRVLAPDAEDLRRRDASGELWSHAPDACCAIRRTAPLARALDGYNAWVTGRKRFQGGLRRWLPVVEASKGRIKYNPLARWSAEDVAAYFEAKELPRHPLEARGFRSVGCWPCTRPAEDRNDPRSGRWAGSDKTECGIHLSV
ncbi:MAG: phosphoadenylyl-sulfate reductase [Parvularculaceae bacterium]